MVAQHHPTRRPSPTATAFGARGLCCLAAIGWCLGTGLTTTPARADNASNSAAAQSLFDEGKALLEKGETEKACEKLAASQRLDPAPGTQFHLAGCYEKLGRTASAWALYLEVAAAAKSKGRGDAEQAARSAANALAPKLSTLKIVVPAEVRIDGLEIKRDGQLIAADLYGSAVAIDPGKHQIEASAPGYQSFKGELEVKPNADAVTFSLPALKAETAPGEAPGDPAGPSTPADSASTSSFMPWPYVSLGVGVLGVGVGSFFILKSSSKRADADALFEECGGDGCRNSDPRSTQIAEFDDAARSAQTLGTIGFVVGGLGVAGAVVMFLLEPSRSEHASQRSHRSKATLTPWLGPAAAGLSGQF